MERWCRNPCESDSSPAHNHKLHGALGTGYSPILALVGRYVEGGAAVPFKGYVHLIRLPQLPLRCQPVI